MRATVFRGKTSDPRKRWRWIAFCICRSGYGRAPTQPEALAAALAHLATHHPKEDQT